MERIRLKSGREVMIRPIRVADGPALCSAYERLSPQSKYERFLGPKPRLNAADVRYLTQIDGVDHYALVATPVGQPAAIIAVARFVRLTDDDLAAEFAVVVGDQFQRDGLGGELVDRLAIAARARGITRFTATMLAANEPAHRLMQRLAAGGLRPHNGTVARTSQQHLGPIDHVVVEQAALRPVRSRDPHTGGEARACHTIGMISACHGS